MFSKSHCHRSVYSGAFDRFGMLLEVQTSKIVTTKKKARLGGALRASLCAEEHVKERLVGGNANVEHGTTPP